MLILGTDLCNFLSIQSNIYDNPYLLNLSVKYRSHKEVFKNGFKIYMVAKCNYIWQKIYRVERKKEEFLHPLSWSVHHNFACDGYVESTTFPVSKQDF
jgi:hypothetical protein